MNEVIDPERMAQMNFAYMVKAFQEGPVYQYLVGVSEQDKQEASEMLAYLDQDTQKEKFNKWRVRYQVADSFMKWLDEAIEKGKEAQESG